MYSKFNWIFEILILFLIHKINLLHCENGLLSSSSIFSHKIWQKKNKINRGQFVLNKNHMAHLGTRFFWMSSREYKSVFTAKMYKKRFISERRKFQLKNDYNLAFFCKFFFGIKCKFFSNVLFVFFLLWFYAASIGLF